MATLGGLTGLCGRVGGVEVLELGWRLGVVGALGLTGFACNAPASHKQYTNCR